MLTWPIKDPDDVLDYAIDWSPRLAGDTISSSDWSIESETSGSPNLSLQLTGSPAAYFQGPLTTVWLAGGIDGETAYVQNRITTAGGRTMDETVRLRIRSR